MGRVKVVVTTSKKTGEYEKTEEWDTLQKLESLDEEFYIQLIEDNSTGLSRVYQEVYEDTDEGIVTFIHDDVMLEDVNFSDKIREGHKTFDMIGLAGATKIIHPWSPEIASAWHMVSQEKVTPSGYKGPIIKRHISGCVVHQQGDEHWGVAFGKYPKPCVLLDGIFLSFNLDKTKETEFKFDTDFDFHHYDLAASLAATSNGLSIGTWPIHVIHKSIGEMDESWKKSHYKFVKKYGN